MFTGIIEKTGRVLSNLHHEGANRLIIDANFEQLQVGESIAVNGVCLTLLPAGMNQLSFDVSLETLGCTIIGTLIAGDVVNLERAMCVSARFGGHYVSGHVDAIIKVQHIKPINEYMEIELGPFNAHALLYLIPKGSITVDGVSLTINSVDCECIKLMLVPHTLLSTTLGALKPGQSVNIEFDYLTRIVAHQLQIAGSLRMI